MEESVQQHLIALKAKRLDRSLEMPMMITVAIVIAQHPAIIDLGQKMVDKRKVVTSHFACLVLPNLFSNHSRPSRTPE